MTIGKKLVAAFGAILGAALMLAIASGTVIHQLQRELDKTINKTAQRQYLAGEIGSTTAEMAGLERGIVLSSMLGQNERTEAYKQQFQKDKARLQRATAEFRAIADTDQLQRSIASIAGKASEVASAHEEFLHLIGSQQMDAALKAFEDRLLPRVTEISMSGNAMIEEQKQALAQSSKDASASSSRAAILLGVLVIIVLLTGSGVLLNVRKVSSELRHLGAEMASGAGDVASVASQVSTASQSLARGAAEQSQLLEKTAASAEEITTITRNNADNSRAVAELMKQSANTVGKANGTLDQMIESMRAINASSGKISRIMKVIDEIAFQTNILALNAAVEAARAGEAGLGFAVVADEVRNLAQRCAQAAKDTSELIAESISRSADGNTKLDEVASAIRALTENADQIKNLVDEVNIRSQEQARGIEEISRAVVQIEKVTHSNATSADQSASAGSVMTTQADHLNQIAGDFWAMVGGEDTARAAASVN